ncbi:ABC transporter substrate-binding protein, partial [Gardnerella vaginalis]
DKQSYQRAKGGAVAGGFATTLITPGVSERKVYNLYSANPRGDVEKAKQLLKESGKSKLKFSLIARPDQAQVASSIQASLKRVGIYVSIRTVDSQIFTDMITGNSGDYDLALSKWQPDFPSAYANIGPLFDSSQIGGGNWNISRYSNPKVDSLISQAVGVIDKSRADLLWQQVDKEIMRDSPIVPLIYSKNTYIHGSNVENFFVGSFPAYPSYARVSLIN